MLIENVAVLRSRGLDVIMSDLARLGYGCWWDCYPALSVGAPHLRDRVWISAVPLEMMPDLDGRPLGATTSRMPRAVDPPARGMIEMAPQATIKMCKQAMGAIKRDDGTTWLTKLDSPLFPTPSASSYGYNQGGAAGRVGRRRHGLESMARLGAFPEAVGAGCRPLPTASAEDWKDVGDGRMGRGQLPEAVRDESAERGPADPDSTTDVLRLGPPARPDLPGPCVAVADLGDGHSGDSRLWPTPRASANELRTRSSAPSHGKTHGRVLSGVVCDHEIASGRAVPISSGSAGPLSADWAEWLMGIPVGFTDLDCDHPVHLDWLSEHDLPRVMPNVPMRKERLTAIGNSLVSRVAYTRLVEAHALLGIKT